MNDEREVEARLRAAASRVSARPDLVEVESGAARHRSRRRAGTAVVAAMLVAGAGGAGFGLGRAATGADGEELVAPATVSESTGETVPSKLPAETLLSTTTTVPLATVAPGIPDGDHADEISSVWAPQEYELLQTRTLEGGYALRVLLGPDWGDGMDPGATGWQPARFCYGTRDLRIGIAGPDLIDVTSTSWSDELFKGRAINWAYGGWADGRPFRLLAAQATLDATELAVTWDDGAADRVRFEDGLALSLTWGGPVDAPAKYTAEITMADGSVLQLTERDQYPNDDPDWRAACEPPPPPLPSAGEQPADPEAAEAEIREKLRLVFDTSIPADEKPQGLLDDDTGVADARAAIEDGPYADVAATAVHVIEELVFTSPTEAWFRYAIDTDNGFFRDRFGIATFVEGGWRISRRVVCQDVGLAGAYCEPPAEPIHPPGHEPDSEEALSEEGATPPPATTAVPAPGG